MWQVDDSGAANVGREAGRVVHSQLWIAQGNRYYVLEVFGLLTHRFLCGEGGVLLRAGVIHKYPLLSTENKGLSTGDVFL